MTPQSGLLSQVLTEEGWVCVGRRGHPALRRRLSLKNYAGLRHLGVRYPEPDGGSGMIDRQLAEHGLTRTCPARCRISSRAVSHCADRLHRDASPTTRDRVRASAAVTARQAPLPEPTAISLVWHSRAEGDPTQRWLRKIIIEAFAAQTRSRRHA